MYSNFHVPRSISFSVIMQKHTHKHIWTPTHTYLITFTHTHSVFHITEIVTLVTCTYEPYCNLKVSDHVDIIH